MSKFRFSMDRGGTFLDCLAILPDGSERVIKLLSEDPEHYSDAPTEAIRRAMLDYFDGDVSQVQNGDGRLRSERIQYIRMGTTVATNALLERKGARVALVTTKGFGDLLQIGNQSRDDIFDLQMRKMELLYECVVEANERVCVAKHWPSGKRNLQNDDDDDASRQVLGVNGEYVRVLEELDVDGLEEPLRAVYERGVRSVAVVLMHSYAFREHEQAIGRLCARIGFTQVSLSGDVMPMVRIVPRGATTCVDAYLTPLIRDYMRSFMGGFDEHFEQCVQLHFMMSDGGLCLADSFCGFKAILSGPAGGVVACARAVYERCSRKPLISLDMGGSSTDSARYSGAFEHVYDAAVAGVTIQAPQLAIETVAAGGGSVLGEPCDFAGLLAVGPKSVGAHPGPVCYAKGGEWLSLTDANVLLGRVVPSRFPHIFGPQQDQPLDVAATRRRFVEYTQRANAYFGDGGDGAHLVAACSSLSSSSSSSTAACFTPESLALGYVAVANETMCRAIRSITVAKGLDCADHVLTTFGGAGGQHACAVARILGIGEIFVHRHASILSAYGIGLADVVEERSQPCAARYESDDEAFTPRLEALETEARAVLRAQGFDDADVRAERYLNMRYDGTDTQIMVLLDAAKRSSARERFLDESQRANGFVMERERVVCVDDVRVRVIGRVPHASAARVPRATDARAVPTQHVPCYFDEPHGFVERTPLFDVPELGSGATLDGPALLIHHNTSVLVEPGWRASVTEHGDLRIVRVDNDDAQASQAASSSSSSSSPPTATATTTSAREGRKSIGTELNSVYLSIFSHRFMSVAEQMGRVLQRTAISTNIKERLDYSCALFSEDGGLVANAPHLPVHLGAMQQAVRWQINELGERWQPSQVIMSNHPAAGGSHLPDITVMTPVFCEGAPVFYVANRGHHADIGGVTPGSMPPFSKSLREEGCAFKSFTLVGDDGRFRHDEVCALLSAPCGVDERGEPIVGTRNLTDNLSDLRAQVAANHRGVLLMQQLIDEFGLRTVLAYMHHVKQSAEEAVREMLVQVSLRHNLRPIDTVEAVDYMDDGSPIRLRLTIDRGARTALFDFAGTGEQVAGNWNAPRAVTFSAVIYALRCQVKRDVPLNQGCLEPIRIVLPDNCLLSPDDDAAIVGGNVLTSQRVTDVVLKAFRAAADSYGCMNNLTFGDRSFGFYSTFGGGGGAGPTWHGAHAVQCHMTNTRVTDSEVLERRYPVLLRRFAVRRGSGGQGAHRGGDGVVYELEFLRQLSFGILSERRAIAPHGIEGGSDGARGLNIVVRANAPQRRINVGSKFSCVMQPHDRFILETPGGGGFGSNS
jgi:5-oxoprolinase (ATP-hydrolysing)